MTLQRVVMENLTGKLAIVTGYGAPELKGHIGKVVEVLHDDGLQCFAQAVGGSYGIVVARCALKPLTWSKQPDEMLKIAGSQGEVIYRAKVSYSNEEWLEIQRKKGNL